MKYNDADSESNDSTMWAEYHAKRAGTTIHALHVLKRTLICRMFAAKVLDMAGPVTSVLELGCGTGSVLSVIARRTGARALGVDRDAGCIDTARRCYPAAQYEQGDIFELPYPPKAFDLVYSIGLLEHFTHDDQKRLLSIHARYATRYIALMVPADSLIMNTILFLNKRILKRSGVWADEEVFSRRSLSRKFPGYDFRATKDHRFGNMILWFGCRP